MLILNKGLQQIKKKTYIRFTQGQYAPSGTVFIFLTKIADVGQLISQQSNLLIPEVKTVDPAVVGIEVLEHWQRLKVYGMLLKINLGEGKIKLLRRKVESTIEIQLK